MPRRLVIVDPGHFHAALVQKEMYPALLPEVHVHAPVGLDLADYLTRIARFNTRPENPTAWTFAVHAGPDYLARLGDEEPGGICVLSGRNRNKIGLIEAAVGAGLHVLADKPAIIRRADLPRLERVAEAAQAKGLVLADMMGGRAEIVGSLLRLLHADPEVFGDQLPGSPGAPAVEMTSVHHLMKQVAGVPNPRPAWYFDVAEQGDALADIGTHLVDRIHNTLFPGAALDYRADIAIGAVERWSTIVTAAQFREVTGEALAGDSLDYPCNARLGYAVCGIHVGLDLRWNWEAEPGGDDMHTALYRGSKARLEIRHGPAEGWRPQLYIVPEGEIAAAFAHRIEAAQPQHPGVGFEQRGDAWRVTIPDALRVGHDPQFAALTRRFLGAVEDSASVPRWERQNLIAKSFVCTAAEAHGAQGGER
ncbi:MAG TPA: putative oxidoreductase C-terminal domain-containing protein [Stellaceae bacterium]|jgi:predicted dehydrogenase